MHEIETESESSSLLCLEEDKSPFPSGKDPGLCDEINNGSRPQDQLIEIIEADVGKWPIKRERCCHGCSTASNGRYSS